MRGTSPCFAYCKAPIVMQYLLSLESIHDVHTVINHFGLRKAFAGAYLLAFGQRKGFARAIQSLL